MQQLSAYTKRFSTRFTPQHYQWLVLFSVALFGIVVGLVLNSPQHRALVVSWFYASGLSGKSDFQIGQYYFENGNGSGGQYDLPKATYYYSRAVHHGAGQTNDLVWYQLGRTEFIEGNFYQAIYSFKQQIKLHKDQVPNVYYMLGLTYGYLARRTNGALSWREAEKNFRTYITYAPDSPWPRVDLAWVLFSEGKFQAMKPLLQAGLSAHPHNPWLLNMYGLYQLNTPDQKPEAYNTLLAAQQAANTLTPADWGQVYPGNDPRLWPQGLREFQTTITQNLQVAKSYQP